MKQLSLTLVLMLSVILVFAQASNYIDYFLGPPMEENQYNKIYSIVGADDDGVYLYEVSERSGRQSWTKFNSKLEFERREMINPGFGLEKGESISNPFSLFFAGHLLLCGITYGADKKINLTAIEIDKKTLIKTGDTMNFLVSSPSFSLGAYLKRDIVEFSTLSGFDHYISKGKKKLLVSGIPIQDRDENQELSVAVYDSDLSRDWGKNFILPYSHELLSLRELIVDDFGNIYIIAMLFHEIRGYKIEGKPNYEYLIFRLNKDETKPVEFRISSKEHFITSLSVGIYPDGRILGVGFYTDNFDNLNINGTVTAAFDLNTGMVKDQSFKPFSQEVLANFMSEQKADKGKPIKELTYREIYYAEDGSACILAELGDEMTDIESYGISSNEIIAIKLNPQFEVVWVSVIPKNQSQHGGDILSANTLTDFLSFISCTDGNNILIFYNDNQVNAELAGRDNIEKAFDKSGFAAFVAVIEPNGKWQKFSLFENPEVSQLITPGLAYAESDKVLYLYLEDMKTSLQFGKKATRLTRITLKK